MKFVDYLKAHTSERDISNLCDAYQLDYNQNFKAVYSISDWLQVKHRVSGRLLGCIVLTEDGYYAAIFDGEAVDDYSVKYTNDELCTYFAIYKRVCEWVEI